MSQIIRKQYAQKTFSFEAGFRTILLMPSKYKLVFSMTLIESYPYTCLERPVGFQEIEAPRISRQSTHEGGKIVNHTHRPPFAR